MTRKMQISTVLFMTVLAGTFIFGFTVGVCITVFVMLVPKLKRLIEVVQFLIRNRDFMKKDDYNVE